MSGKKKSLANEFYVYISRLRVISSKCVSTLFKTFHGHSYSKISSKLYFDIFSCEDLCRIKIQR